MEEKKASIVLDRLAFFVVLAAAFLLPVFFLPVTGITLDVSKATLLYPAVGIAFVLWLVARLIDGNFFIPKTSVLVFLFAIPVAFLVSALISPAKVVSLFGIGAETGTFLSILIFAVATFLSSVFFQSKNNVFYFYSALLASFVLVAAFQIVRITTGGAVLSLGVFSDLASNLVGKWNDLAIFLGLIIVLSLSALEFLTLSALLRMLVIGSVVVSLGLLAIINFSLAWLVTGLFALALFLYGHYYAVRESGVVPVSPRAWFLKTSFFVFVVCAVFYLFTLATDQNLLFYRGTAEREKFLRGEVTPSRFEINQLEVRPSISGTWDIIKYEKGKNFWFGAGPNRFVNEWLMAKPSGVNESPFWGNDFNFGYGLIPSFAVTTGFVGFLATVLFIISFVIKGGRAMLGGGLTRVSSFVISSSFLGSLFLWVFLVAYVPGVSLITLAFIVTGLSIGVLVSEGFVRRTSFSVFSSRVTSFVAILGMIVLLIGMLYGLYQLVTRFSSVFLFAEASTLAANSKLDEAEKLLTKAAGRASSDVYHRALSELGLLKLNALVNQTGADVSRDVLQKNFLDTLGNSIKNAEEAVKFDNTNYLNYVTLARIYEAILPIVPQNSYESSYRNAKLAYDQALVLNPHSPGLYLTEARLEIAHRDLKAVRALLGKALEKKTNYTEAVFLLSQLEATENNIRAAIARAEDAARLAPNNIVVFFQLGLLKYNDRDYRGAIEALERAVLLNNNYSNARYFLGLSYEKLGRNSDAIAQFVRIEELNPDNSEVKQILSNLRAGRDPFVSEPTRPERRSRLPVRDEN